MAFLSVLSLVASLVYGQQAGALQPSVGTPIEYQVKAAYILNFVNLTEWPAAALGPPASPFRICVAGNDPFRGALESTVKGEAIQGHPIVVERLTRADAGQTCHVLFVSDGNATQIAELLQALGTAPVLTIGEADAFLRRGGVVRFVVDQGHVRFDVSRRSAERRGLTLSSRLLRVARSVQ
jgi:hypothetical protein